MYTSIKDTHPVKANKPWVSSIGLLLWLVAAGARFHLLREIHNASGFAVMGPGYTLLGLWLLMISLSIILGIVSLVRKESPKLLSGLLFTFSILAIIYFIVTISRS